MSNGAGSGMSSGADSGLSNGSGSGLSNESGSGVSNSAGSGSELSKGDPQLGGAYWELDAGTNGSLWTATHAVYGLLGALLFVFPFVLAVPVFWVIERTGVLSLLALVLGVLALKVAIWFVVWPALTAGTGPVSLPWSDEVSIAVLVQAVLGWLLALFVAVRYWPAPVLMAGAGLAVGLPVIRLGWTRGEVDAATGALSVEGERVPTEAVRDYRRLNLGSVSLFWVRYATWTRSRRLFLVPAAEAETVAAVLEGTG